MSCILMMVLSYLNNFIGILVLTPREPALVPFTFLRDQPII